MQHAHNNLKVYGGIKIYAGEGSPELAGKIAAYLEQPLSGRDVIEFPNENLFVKLHGSARGQDVYVIQTTSSPVHKNLMELLIMIQTLRLDSAARITAVIPYLCYGRSDKKDQPRVPISSRLVADMIEVAGADRLMLGTDYPYDNTGEKDPVGALKRAGLRNCEQILGKNAADLLGISD